jgi:ABC-type Na+ efflux pump permease subunit
LRASINNNNSVTTAIGTQELVSLSFLFLLSYFFFFSFLFFSSSFVFLTMFSHLRKKQKLLSRGPRAHFLAVDSTARIMS